MTTIVPGQEIAAYRIVEQIGKGGMASVYKAYQATMDRYVALKILPFEFSRNAEFRERFRREVVTIAKLEHPHILPVYDSGEYEGTPYLVMRYLEAGTLKDRMRRGRLSLEKIDRIFSQLADALEYAHRHDVVHRDIKPSNVMLTARDDVLLTDFGIAKLLGADTQVTATGAITGTPAYMSPEQGDGRRIDHRSDIYSLGIVLYEMITGRVPFEAETPLAIILKHLQAPLPPPSSIADVSPAIEAVVLKALAKDPGERYPSTTAFLDAWSQALHGTSPVDQTIAETSAPARPADTPTYVEPGAHTLADPDRAAGRSEGDSAPSHQVSSSRAESASVPPAAPVSPAARTTGEVPAAPLSTPAPSPSPKPMPRRRSLGWLLLAGAASVLVLGLCGAAGFAYYRVCCAPAPDSQGVLPQGTDSAGDSSGQPSPSDAAGEPSGQTPPVAATGADEPFVQDPLPFPLSGGTWTSWAGTGEIPSVVRHDGFLYAGSASGILVYDAGLNHVDTITVRDGLRSNSVRYLFSDPETGDLWAATDDGAARHDGSEWITYGYEDGLEDSSLVFVGRVGADIMAGAAYGLDDGGIYVFDGSGWSTLPGFDSTPGGSPTQFDSSVREVLLSPDDGLVWAATGNGLGAWDGSGWTRYTTEDGLPDNLVNGLGIDGQGRLIVSTEGGAVMVENSAFTPLEPTLGFAITDILVDVSGNTWFPGGDGVFRYAPGTGNWDFYEAGIDFPTYGVYRGAAVESGEVYFGTSDLGLVAFDGAAFSPLALPDGPNQPAAGLVLVEPTGSLLFVEEYGLNLDQFDPGSGTWTDITPEACCIVPFAFDAAGNLWGGGDTGLWQIAPDGSTLNLTTGDGLPADLVLDLAVGPGDEIWVGTENGLARIVGGAVVETVSPLDLGLDSPEVFTLLRDSQGGTWAGTASGLLHRSASGEWETFTEGNPFSESYAWISAVEEGLDGSIWVSAYGDGVFRYLEGAWWHYEAGGGLPSPSVNAITIAPDGSAWFATDSGAARYDGVDWWAWGIEDGLSHWYVNAIVVLEDGTTWFATSGGITRWMP